MSSLSFGEHAGLHSPSDISFFVSVMENYSIPFSVTQMVTLLKSSAKPVGSWLALVSPTMT